MSLLDPDLINKELTFDAMPDALGLIKISREDIMHNRKFELPGTLYMAQGAQLINIQMIFYPHDAAPGWIIESDLISKPYDPRWGDTFPRRDFFSNRWPHLEEMLERHTSGMLNIERLVNLNRIFKSISTKP